MIEFITQRFLGRGTAIREETPLLSSGLVDSFALVEVLVKLEQLTGKRIGAGRASPKDFETVQRMLELADRC